jgi:hypothetical protein
MQGTTIEIVLFVAVVFVVIVVKQLLFWLLAN